MQLSNRPANASWKLGKTSWNERSSLNPWVSSEEMGNSYKKFGPLLLNTKFVLGDMAPFMHALLLCQISQLKAKKSIVMPKTP
jgi:hypothetical protein